jgi:hypothetical protein
MVAIPTDPFYSAKSRIKRADEQLDNLTAEIDRFFTENPGGYVSEPDPDGTHEIHKIKFTKRFPLIWRILATEIIEHLRASLDHATFASFFLSTGKLDSNFVAFPFGKTAPDLDNGIRGRSKDLRPEIQTLLRSFDTYKGGNDVLCTLNDLCNDCKHGLIAFIVGATAGFEITGTAFTGPIEFADPLIWDADKNEIVYARVLKGSNFEHKGKLRVYVSIPDVEVMPGAPATAILDRMGSEVDRIVRAIEAECKRLGLLT